MSHFTLTNLRCIFSCNIKNFIRMAGNPAMERIKKNAEAAKQTIEELKNELNVINREYNNMLAKQLKEENVRLLAAVEEAKKNLIQLEVKNGIKQISVPNRTVSTSSRVHENVEVITEPPPSEPKKEKKEKKPKEHKEPAAELPIDVGRLDLRIGRIESVERHPDADTLYLLKINCGEENPRTVCSGLVKHVPIDELRDRVVIVLCNLKPVKMRGITSEAMVMCASSEAGVEVLNPPEGSLPGDLVHCEGYAREPDSIMNPKKKIFETVAPDLHTDDNLQACYKNVPFTVPGKGVCTAISLKNVPVK